MGMGIHLVMFGRAQSPARGVLGYDQKGVVLEGKGVITVRVWRVVGDRKAAQTQAGPLRAGSSARGDLKASASEQTALHRWYSTSLEEEGYRGSVQSKRLVHVSGPQMVRTHRDHRMGSRTADSFRLDHEQGAPSGYTILTAPVPQDNWRWNSRTLRCFPFGWVPAGGAGGSNPRRYASARRCDEVPNGTTYTSSHAQGRHDQNEWWQER
jgi:hypothetical protein